MENDWSGMLEDPAWSEKILADRARQFAVIQEKADGEAKVAVVLFRLRQERYAVELRLLRRVQLAKEITPVPCTPRHIAGILNVRGEIVTVLDLANALGMGDPIELTESSRVLLVELPDGKVGLLVDEVQGDRLLEVGKLDRPLSGRDFTRGVAEASIVFLELEPLLAAGRFDVQEELT